MNAVLAGTGGVFAALFAGEVLGVLIRPNSVVLASGVLGPVARAATRGREASRPEIIRLGLTAVACGSSVALLVGGPWLAVAVAISCPLGTVAVLRMRRSRWRAEMIRATAPCARAIGDAARAGLPAVAAIERASDDGAVPEAAAVEMGDLAVRCRLGLPLEDGLEDLRARVRCRQWDALVAAIGVQRQVGGDLASILYSLAHGLEHSARALDEARSLNSQARLTARIVIALPVAGLAMGEIASPGTMGRVLSEPLPRALTLVAAVLQVSAVVVVRRIARLGASG